jgi:hypothetical protein
MGTVVRPGNRRCRPYTVRIHYTPYTVRIHHTPYIVRIHHTPYTTHCTHTSHIIHCTHTSHIIHCTRTPHTIHHTILIHHTLYSYTMPSCAQLEQLPSLTSVFEEAIRLFPSVPGVTREAKEDVDVLGYRLSKVRDCAILDTIHYTRYDTHCTRYDTHYTRYDTHYTRYDTHYTRYDTHCTQALHTVLKHYTLFSYTMHWTHTLPIGIRQGYRGSAQLLRSPPSYSCFDSNAVRWWGKGVHWAEFELCRGSRASCCDS